MRRAAIIILVTALLAVGLLSLDRFRQRLKAYETAGRIQTMSSLLRIERPAVVTEAVLSEITSKHKHSEVLIDGWGRPLKVVKVDGRYLVSSAARDGIFSGVMAAGEEATPDTDLIAADGEWIQVWN
jgi:hypothetical protein